MLTAARRRGTVHALLQLRPWEMSPVDVQLTPEPNPDTKIIWLQSYWMAMRLREQLLAAASGLQAASVPAREEMGRT
jgi:hypothetical protein